MSALHVVVPEGIHDVELVSGGNVYDARLVDGLRALGRDVVMVEAAGTWPHPRPDDAARLASALSGMDDGATVLVDGLVASAVPDVLVPESRRLQVAALVHMPLGAGAPDTVVPDAFAREAAVLRSCARIVATSPWVRGVLVSAYDLDPAAVVVAAPGCDAAEAAAPSASGARLVAVGAISRGKGHDLLVEALALLPDLDWSCTLVGSTARDPGFVQRLERRVAEAGIADRIVVAGVRVGRDLDEVLAASDLLVHPSRGETYGMVVDEALARGIPVVASDVGGLPGTLGGDERTRPGMLVPPADPAALAAALRRWLADAALRGELRQRALARREQLVGWDSTAAVVSAALGGAA